MNSSAKTIGIQVGAISFLDEGIPEVLNAVQSLGAVNTIFLNTFGYDIGLGGRQIPGYPYPGHGEPSQEPFVGGYIGRPHLKHFAGTSIQPATDRDCGDRDLLEEVISVAHEREITVHACNIDRYSSHLPGGDQAREMDHHGRPTKSYCMANPEYRRFWLGITRDLTSTYDIDGMLVFNERNGPLLNAIGATQYASIDPASAACFCPYHVELAEKHGINVERARAGYSALEQLVSQVIRSPVTAENPFVSFLELLIEYPEIQAWEALWTENKFEFCSDIAKETKDTRPNVEVGFHVSHVNSFSLIYRAEWTISKLSSISDYLKVVVYHHVAGIRYRQFLQNLQSTIFKGVPSEALFRMSNSMLGYHEMIEFEDQPASPFPPEYVSRETIRAKEKANGSCHIYPGIGIDISHANIPPELPETIYASTLAALSAGADGLIFSRKYSEMRLSSLEAAGNAVRDFYNEKQ
jgi:hypothetical protein